MKKCNNAWTRGANKPDNSSGVECWLRDIFDYIAVDNPAAAEKVVSGLYAKPSYYTNFQKSATCTEKNPMAIFAFCCTVITESRI
ncbi:MAG: hypothetical protein K9L79_04375 [Methylobacter tundripaludum]|nr:hypothetical protein [Methylobacter tundripaludum]